ncbi:MAG: hypothetical protein ACREQW_21980 [Candidatus Binatia bacterium]
MAKSFARSAVLTTPVYGEANFMWSSDYPHAACTWPHSQNILYGLGL